MAVGDFKTWAVQSQDAPAHVARILQTILLNEGVVDKAGNSFQVLEDTGSNMNIVIGSGTVGDIAVIEGDDAAGQGVYVHEAQNGTVTRAVAASDPSDPRIDLVVLQNYDDEADSSGLNDAEVEVIQGTPAGSPTAPALPSSAVPLAEVEVGAGVTAITNANITDLRADARSAGAAPSGGLGYAERTTSGSNVTTVTDITGLSVTIDVPAGRRIRIVGHGQISLNASGTETIAAVGWVREGSTKLGRWGSYIDNHSGSRSQLQDGSVVVAPSSGSHTYKLSLERTTGAGTVNLVAAADNPAFIVVEDLGPA